VLILPVKVVSQTKPGRCQLNLVDGDHRRRRGRSLIFRCAGHDNTRRSPGNAILAAIPRRDKHLQVGFLVKSRGFFLHDFHPVDGHLGNPVNLIRIVDHDPAITWRFAAIRSIAGNIQQLQYFFFFNGSSPVSRE